MSTVTYVSGRGVFNGVDIVTKYCLPEVRIPNGVVQGQEAFTVMNKVKYFKFEGIPYAQPPVGDLRFQPPVPPSNWRKPLKAFNGSISCYQGGLTYDKTSEDCLYLNVYTTQLPKNGQNPALPIILYFYGGRFVDGASRDYRPEYLIEEDVIVVIINYREGVFGFLSTEDTVIPGNIGLKDQVLSMQWVQNNIEYFGGDPQKVTIVGHSAGSIAVTLHLMNSKSKGLFRAAIALSGTFTVSVSEASQPRQTAFKLLEFLGKSLIDTDNSTELLEVFRAVPAADLDRAASQMEQFVLKKRPTLMTVQKMVWGFVVEKETSHSFATKKNMPLLRKGHFLRVPLLMTMESEEGIDAVELDQLMNLVQSPTGLPPTDMYFSNYKKHLQMNRRIADFYTGGEPFTLVSAIKYFSDATFNVPLLRFADIYAKYSKVFYMMFSYDGPLGQFDVDAYNLSDTGRVGHKEIVYYYLCFRGTVNCDLSQYSATDRLMSKRVITVITNFVKYLDPLPEPSDVLPNITSFPEYSVNTERRYLNLNETVSIGSFPKKDSYLAWKNFYDMVDHCPSCRKDL